MIYSPSSSSRTVRTLRALAPACAALALLGTAQLSHAGPYGSISVGQSFTDVDCLNGCDRKKTSGKAILGYRFGDSNFAIEGSYFQAGHITEDVQGTSWYTSTVKAQGLGVGAAYFLPFGDSWMGVLRGGLAAVKAKGNYRDATTVIDQSTTATQPYAGLGVSYMITPQFSVDATYDWNRMKLNSDSAHVHTVRIGLSYWL